MRLCLKMFLFCLLGNVQAEELITTFHSDIVIQQSGQIAVTESIEVNAENNNINRGIFRDFPTQYFGALLTQKQVGFEVKSVTRNGHAEPFHTEQLNNGIRVYMGSSDVYLDRGLHQYQLVYSTDQQLGYFDGYDEFYWNVTGTGWAFPIQQASASITLPANGRQRIIDQSAWTGYQGEQNQDFILMNTADKLGFKTTQRLEPYQGLTIGVQVPKGVFERAPFDWLGFIKNNVLWLMAMVVSLFYLGFYVSAWYRFGRDPEPGTLIARYTPPKNLSPAAVHYIDNEGSTNDKSFVAALLSMAVKGYITITQMKKQYRIKLKKGQTTAALSAGEKAVKKRLFSGRIKQVTIGKQYNSSVRSAKGALQTKLKTEFHEKCFVDNRFYAIWGWVISLLCFFIVTLLIYSQTMGMGDLLATMLVFCIVVIMAMGFLVAAPIFMGVILLIILASHYVELLQFVVVHRNWLYFVMFLLALNFLFGYLLRAPTPFGRHIKDEIDGLKLYIKAAEAHRLNRMNPPDKTLEHYEELLPYAVALNLENQWAEQFTTVLNLHADQQTGHHRSYQPKWYNSKHTHVSDFNTSLGAMTQDMKRTVARATTTPSASRSSSSGSYSSGNSSSSSSYSSSSSSGGSSSSGSSGGGGGGGGGGGW